VIDYAASGTARARLSAVASLARIVRSAWNRSRSMPRMRSEKKRPFVLEAAELSLDGSA
jgi:hypothetical protein